MENNSNLRSLHDKYDFFTINVPRIYKVNTLTPQHIIEIIDRQYSNGWNLFMVVQPYIIFYKKKPLIERVKIFFKKFNHYGKSKEIKQV